MDRDNTAAMARVKAVGWAGWRRIKGAVREMGTCVTVSTVKIKLKRKKGGSSGSSNCYIWI